MCFASVQASFIGSVGPIFLKAMIHVELFSNHDSALLLGIHVQYALISMKLRLPAKNPRENALNIIFFMSIVFSSVAQWFGRLRDKQAVRVPASTEPSFFHVVVVPFLAFFFLSPGMFSLYFHCCRFI